MKNQIEHTQVMNGVILLTRVHKHWNKLRQNLRKIQRFFKVTYISKYFKNYFFYILVRISGNTGNICKYHAENKEKSVTSTVTYPILSQVTGNTSSIARERFLV